MDSAIFFPLLLVNIFEMASKMATVHYNGHILSSTLFIIAIPKIICMSSRLEIISK